MTEFDRYKTTDPFWEGPAYAECLGCGDRTGEDDSELDGNDLCPDCVNDNEEDIA